MKRGLKDSQHHRQGYKTVGYNRLPNEKGTERLNNSRCLVVPKPGYNRFPDEKGTESLTLNFRTIVWLELQSFPQ